MNTHADPRGRGRRGLVSLIVSAFLVLATAGVTLVSSGSPASADPVGDCTATSGAIVAVDFGHWGGSVVRGCDAHPTTGMNLLHNAGFSTTGTVHDGPGFICRIGTAGFHGGDQYPTAAEEGCRTTPLPSAYWSYWIAPPGQDTWTYSPLGALGDVPKDGEVEAWVFGATDVGGTSGQPAFTPDSVRAKNPGGGTPTTTPPTTTPTTSPSGSNPPAAEGAAAGAQWLVEHLTDGDHVQNEAAGEIDYARTVDTAIALAAAGGQDPALTRIVAFLSAHVSEYAYADGPAVPPRPGAIAGLALIAEITGADPQAFGGHNLLTALTDNVCTAAGSLGNCSAAGDFYGAYSPTTDALAVLALARGGVTPPAVSVARVEQMQCTNGGFAGSMILPGERCDAEPGTTGSVIVALARASGADAPAVTKAGAYLLGAQQADGGWIPYEGAPGAETISTAFDTQALTVLGPKDRAAAARNWISGRHTADGGFSTDATATEADLFATTQAVIALSGANLGTLHHDPAGTTPPTTPTTAPPGTSPDLVKGVAYLVAPARLIDGHYYEAFAGSGFADFGLTIDGAYALAAAGGNDAALLKVVDFIDRQGKDGSGRTVNDWTGIGTEYAGGGSLGKEALLAEVTGRDPRTFGGHDLIAALDKAVCAKASGGTDRSCAAAGNYTYATSVFSQSLGIIAQLRAGDKVNAATPITYLESLQNAKGAWPSLIPATGDSDVDSTAMAVMALSMVPGDAAADAVAKGISWIATQQKADGGFPGAAGDSTNSAALAIQALRLGKGSSTTPAADALTFLSKRQNKDGGFDVAAEGQKGSDLRASTQAVGGATGISFGSLLRDLSKVPTTSPTPSTSAPATGTAGGNGGSDAGGSGDRSPGQGGLASTGLDAQRLTLLTLMLLLAGSGAVVVARRRRSAAEGSHR
ncbi:prenyltransferase/squalene oxidase repeat-containing protein [Streptomyces sp. RKAG337]|uniref:prenyltransferase/squalene oxidase repeat-containing protein n=1 Tax=Streptomyces sp. RKAG337 TaxID=2893404 RepID=UPI00203356ED|nr:prenyltransferase/squalene oxidase repeat-containing protein [Streptomyces sp. RKAG337]MCM2424671.1 peptidase [Streptomyces sp. RKAG337]